MFLGQFFDQFGEAVLKIAEQKKWNAEFTSGSVLRPALVVLKTLGLPAKWAQMLQAIFALLWPCSLTREELCTEMQWMQQNAEKYKFVGSLLTWDVGTALMAAAKQAMEDTHVDETRRQLHVKRWHRLTQAANTGTALSRSQTGARTPPSSASSQTGTPRSWSA